MVLVGPKKGVGKQKIAYLVPAEVEHQSAPVRLGTHRACVLVQVRSIKARQCEIIAREMGRHPVHDHPDAPSVQCVHELSEVVGAAKTGGWGVISAHLVPP